MSPLYALGITSSVKKTLLSLQTSFVSVLGASNRITRFGCPNFILCSEKS